MRTRLFTAIELADTVRERIVAEQQRVVSRLRNGGRSLRLVRSEHLHVTLVFIGDVADDRRAAIVRAMSEDIPTTPFRMVLGGGGAFPARGAPRVLYLGVTAGEQDAIDLHDQVVERLAPTGVEREQRPFHPHLTLGRWRDARPSDRPRETPPAVVAEADVRAVALVQSQLSSTGPAYTRLAAAHLVCP